MALKLCDARNVLKMQIHYANNLQYWVSTTGSKLVLYAQSYCRMLLISLNGNLVFQCGLFVKLTSNILRYDLLIVNPH